jgi:hypothetical protein
VRTCKGANALILVTVNKASEPIPFSPTIRTTLHYFTAAHRVGDCNIVILLSQRGWRFSGARVIRPESDAVNFLPYSQSGLLKIARLTARNYYEKSSLPDKQLREL